MTVVPSRFNWRPYSWFGLTVFIIANFTRIPHNIRVWEGNTRNTLVDEQEKVITGNSSGNVSLQDHFIEDSYLTSSISASGGNNGRSFFVPDSAEPEKKGELVEVMESSTLSTDAATGDSSRPSSVSSTQAESHTSNETLDQMILINVTVPAKNKDAAANASTSTTHQQLCTRSQIRQGMWIPTTLPEAPYQPEDVLNVVSNCYGTSNLSSVRPWHTHMWTPTENCTFLQPDTKALCQRLNGEKLVFFGDSLIEEFLHSLAYQMGGINVKPKNWRKRQELTVCGVRMKFFRSVHLVEFLTPQTLARAAPTIIIFNRGAHYKEDNETMIEMDKAISIFEQYQRQKPFTRIFWKTTNTGHPSCWNYHEPVNELNLMEALVANLSLYDFFSEFGGFKASHFHWWDFRHQNKLFLDRLAMSNLTYGVIDAYDLLMRRPDAHKGNMTKFYDCLHQCHPGPHDALARILYHYLQMDPLQIGYK